MTMVAETYEFIVGVDTHSRTHTYALVAAGTGAIEETRTFPASEAGISRAVAWIHRLAGPKLSVIVAIEGTGSYGASLTKALSSSRVRSEAAFAALAGVCPIPASSGNTTRHRLNRNGDRQLNRALDVIARTRLTFDPRTRAYAERRTSEGMNRREVQRCLKRYIARQLYRRLQTIMA